MWTRARAPGLPGGLARLRRALAALRAAPETQDEADALAARIRKVETEVAAARPLDAPLRSAMDRAASAAQRLEVASGEEAKLQAAWQEAARKREEAAAVSEAAQAEVRQLRSELAPAPVQPGVGTAGLEQAVAMVAGTLEAQNAEVTAAVWPFFAAMAAAAARVQGGATAGQDQPAWEGPARPSDGQGATAATLEARSEFCSPEPPMDWQPPAGQVGHGPPGLPLTARTALRAAEPRQGRRREGTGGATRRAAGRGHARGPARARPLLLAPVLLPQRSAPCTRSGKGGRGGSGSGGDGAATAAARHGREETHAAALQEKDSGEEALAGAGAQGAQAFKAATANITSWMGGADWILAQDF